MLTILAFGRLSRIYSLPPSRIAALSACWMRSFAAHSSAVSSDTDDDGATSTSISPPSSSPTSVPVSQQRTLRVAVLGVPNAGKSTLVNALTGAKVSAVSPKTNTTAVPCLGAFTSGEAQVLLLDTPGAVSAKEARGPAHARRIKAAWTSSEECDVALLVVDAARQALRPDRRVTALAAALASSARAAEAREAAERAQEELMRVKEGENGANKKLVEAEEANAAAAAAAAAATSEAAARASGGFGASPPPGWRPPRETILVLNKVDAIPPSSFAGDNREGREEALSRVADSLVRAAATGRAEEGEDLPWPSGGGDEGEEGGEEGEGEGEGENGTTPPSENPPPAFFDAIFALSATRAGSRAVRSLSAALESRAEPGRPWPLLPTDVSDRPVRALAMEIVREKAFLRLRDELPYIVEVVERGWRERGAGDGRKSTRVLGRRKERSGSSGSGSGSSSSSSSSSSRSSGGGGGGGGGGTLVASSPPSSPSPSANDDLDASSSLHPAEKAEGGTDSEEVIEFGNPGSIVAEYDLLVSREPVRRMVVGREGSVVGEIGASARKELEKLLDRKVHLYVTVRVAGRGGRGGSGGRGR